MTSKKIQEWYFWKYEIQSLINPNLIEAGNFSSQISDLSEMQTFLEQKSNWKVISLTLTGKGIPTPSHENILDVKFAREGE